VDVIADLSIDLAGIGDRYRFLQLQQEVLGGGRRTDPEQRARRRAGARFVGSAS
jgi:hypothetical protein